MIPVFKPSITNTEINAVTRTLQSGWLGMGPEVEKFEKEFARWIGRKYAVAVSSCTAALHLAVRCLGPIKAAATTPITFVSTNLALLYEGIAPAFIDVEEDTLNMSVSDLYDRAYEGWDLIVAMHYGGHACDMEAVMEVTADINAYVIEDCAHAIGGYYRGEKLGTFGDIACFSFHAVKNLTCGEGGMLVTDNQEFADRARRLRWCGITKSTYDRAKGKRRYNWAYDVNEIGYKYTMSDINASLGRVQLRRLAWMQSRREKLAKAYDTRLDTLSPDIKPLATRPYAKRAYHNYVVDCNDRDGLREHLEKNGIATGIHYYPNNLFAIFDGFCGWTPTAFNVWKRVLTLPMFPDLKVADVHYICDKIEEFYRG